MRVLIVDDEAPARRKLRRLLSGEDDVDIVGEASNGAEAIACIEDLVPDVVFLDIRMPDTDGFEVIDQVGVERMPLVVFVTAHDEHAVRAFEVRAIDYVLKPIRRARFEEAVARLRDRLATAAPAQEAQKLREVVEALHGAARPLTRLFVRTGDRGRFVAVSDISRFEAQKNYVRVHTASGRHLVRTTLGDLEARLDPDDFLRISRSEIVRLDAVDRVEAWFHGDYRVHLHNGDVLPWTRRYRARHDERFNV